MATRRVILTTGAAAAVVAGLGAAGYTAWAPGLAGARAPWRRAGESLGDPRLDALAYAILAPNPHNMQPWMFELTGADGIDVYCDLDRRLPETDPPDRQITIGFGCLLELLHQAAAEKGYRAEIVPFPDGERYPRLDGRRVASVRFIEDAGVVREPLFAEALTRRTSREPFDTERAVPQAAFDAIVGAGGPSAGGTLDAAMRERLTDIADRAWVIEYENAATRRESVDVMRIGNREVDADPDGLALGGVPLGLMKMAGLVSREKLDTPGTSAYQSGLDMYRKAIATSQGFVWLIADENTRASQIAAGRDWVRMCLAAAREGVSIHPLSQALQEFPEMAGPYARIHEALGAGGDRVVHMFARIGFGPAVPPSVRRPLESKLITA